MKLDEKAYSFIKQAKQAGASIDEVSAFLKQKGYEFEMGEKVEQETQQPQQTQEPSTEYSGPNYVTGATRETLGGLTLGATPYIAGVTNIPANYLAGRFKNPIELFKEGTREYKAEQEKFGEAYPTTATAANIVGSIPTYVVGAGEVSAALKGTKVLANAPKVVKTLTTSVGAMQPIAVQKGIEESLQEDSTIGSIAKATGVGELEALAFGLTFGALNPLESKVLATASKMTGQTKPFTQWLAKQAAKTPFIATEGAAIGTIPALTQGRMPTTEEIISGTVATGALRGVGEVASVALPAARRFLTEPTAQRKAELRAEYEKAQSVKDIDTQIKQGEKRLKEIQQEIKSSKGKEIPMGEIDVDKLFQIVPQEKRKELMSEFIQLPSSEEESRIISEFREVRGKIRDKQGRLLGTKEFFEKADKETYNRAKELSDRHNEIWLSKAKNFLKEKGFYKDNTALEKEAEKIRAKNKELSLAKEQNIEKPTIEIKEATTEEVKAYLKDHPTTNEATAKKIISDAKTRASVAEKKPAAQLGLWEKVRRTTTSGIERVQRFFDELEPLRKTTREREIATGQKTPEHLKSEFTLEERNTGGQADVRIQEVKNVLEPMLKADKDLQRNADAYMQAKKRIDFGKGSALDEEIVSNVQPEVRKYAEEIYKYNQESLDLLKESGRIDEEFYQQLKQKPDYVPSQAENLESIISDEPTIGSIENVVKKFGGEAPFYNETTVASLNQGKRIENFKLMQDAKKQYLRDALDLGRAKKVKTITPEKGKGIPYNKENQIVVWKDGNAEVYEVPEEIAKIFNPKPIGDENVLLTAVRRGQQAFKGLTTGLSVGFAAKNVVRDITGAKASKYGKELTPDAVAEASQIILSPNALLREDVKEVQRAIGMRGTRTSSQIKDRDVADVLDSFSNLDNSLEKAFPEKSGGNKLMQGIALAFQKAGKSLSKMAGKGWQKYLEGASYLGDRSEMVTRYAVWKSALKANAKNEAQLAEWLANPKTIPPEIRAEARKEAREVSLNFTRKMSPMIEFTNRYVIPYFKPAILGGKRMWEVFTNPEIAPQAWNIVANLGALQAAFKTGKMTDEEKAKYSQLNKEMESQNFSYMSDGKLRTVPLNQELAPIVKGLALMQEKIYRTYKGEDREDLMKEALTALKDGALNASLIGSTISKGNAIPQVAKPIVEVGINRDVYTGTDIESKAMRTRPKEERYTESTPEVFKKLGRVVPGLSPVQLHHLWKGYGSSAGKEGVFIFEELSDALKPMVTGEVSVSTKNLNKSNPFVRAFVPNLDTPYNQWAIDANEIIERVKQSHYTMDNKTKRSKLTPERLKDYRLDDKIYNKITPYQQTLTQIRQGRNRVMEQAVKMQDKLNKDIQDGNKTTKEAQVIAKSYEISLRKRLEALTAKEKVLYKKIKDTEKRYKNTPK